LKSYLLIIPLNYIKGDENLTVNSRPVLCPFCQVEMTSRNSGEDDFFCCPWCDGEFWPSNNGFNAWRDEQRLKGALKKPGGGSRPGGRKPPAKKKPRLRPWLPE